MNEDTPSEGTFEAVAWIHSNADTHKVDVIDIFSITGEDIPVTILEMLLEGRTPYQLFESGWDSKVDWDGIPLDTVYRIYVEWAREGNEFSLYLSTLEGPINDEDNPPTLECPECHCRDTDLTTIQDHGMCATCLEHWKYAAKFE